ncbi:hypothetical protein [Pelagovum pacificum]|uniref:Peptidase inhibitor I78 family protein n=1 Tax=Pelagovum pacificum TaxID=2588711 RepID=A0A5C5GKB8_9RHOB|nr:hypothetical protein [Pelagovum pacificum]QQA42960.1 hypothetical protein I8N54_19675 [Pelagovum pacificum]TNY33896.1 hypothetical protein FHY64_11720 [Pelagovum pacificum]
MKIKALTLLLALVACEEIPVAVSGDEENAVPVVAPFVPREPEVNDSSDPCFAGSYLGLLGRQIDNVQIAPAGGLRVVRPGEIPTAEERLVQRLSVRVNGSGTVEQVYCG